MSFSSWVIFGLIFNYWIRRRWGGWWHTYNYITAAGLDSGLILSTIVIFFAIILPNVSIPQWWGNTAPYKTMVRNYIPTFFDVGLMRNIRTLYILQFERLSQMERLLDRRSGDLLTSHINYDFLFEITLYKCRSIMFNNVTEYGVRSSLTSGYL